MDESWRVSIGSVLPRRRSTEEARGRRCLWEEPLGDSPTPLGPDDFHDVFGGPPRTVLLRRFSGELHGPSYPRPASFYDEFFRSTTERPRGAIPRAATAQGRSLPPFGSRARAATLRTEEGFYNDIFGSERAGYRRSRSKSKSSSSVMSFEDLSPPIQAAPPKMAEDTMLSSFASKLRPITIPSKRYVSSPSTISGEEWNSQATFSIDPCPSDTCFLDNSKDSKNKTQSSTDCFLRQRSHIGFSCCFSPPETISLEASFRRDHEEPAGCDYSDSDTPSSVISSVFIDPLFPKPDRGTEDVILEAGPSYMIQINGHGTREKEGSPAIDEAVAWAKQKFWSHQMSKGFDVKQFKDAKI